MVALAIGVHKDGSWERLLASCSRCSRKTLDSGWKRQLGTKAPCGAPGAAPAAWMDERGNAGAGDSGVLNGRARVGRVKTTMHGFDN